MLLRVPRTRRSAYICGAVALLGLSVAPSAAAGTTGSPTAAAASQAPAFTVVSAPDPDPSVDGVTAVAFTAVSAASATDALAVGPNPTEDSTQGPFADHWNGTSWQGMAVPVPSGGNATLEGVADVAPGNGWAVGYTNNPDATTGNTDSTLIEHWNGSGWSIVPSPDPISGQGAYDELDAIAAVSPTDIWAAGDELSSNGGGISPLFEHYNGSTWTAVSAPNAGGGFALGLVAISSTDVWMVGTTTQAPISAHWNGTSWTAAATPAVNAGPNPVEFLTGVTALSSTDVWASGYVANVDNENMLEPIMLNWTGSAWKTVTVPNPGSEGTRLNGITSTGKDVFAVGTTQEENGSLLTLVEEFNGSSWATVPSPDPGQNGTLTDNVLTSAASAGGVVWAVGALNQAGQCCDLPLSMDATVPAS